MIKSEEILAQHGLRKTDIRIKVINELISKEYAISQPELEHQFSNQVDRVTLYRTLNTLEVKGIVHKVLDRAGLSRFAMCSTGCSEHSHYDEHLHFQCLNCSNIYCLSISVPPKFHLPEGFSLHTMRINVDGVCRTCSV